MVKNKRSIILSENGQIVFRHDIDNVNGNDFIERDIFDALCIMDKMLIIKSKKLLNLLKIRHGLTISDYLDMGKEIFTNNNENWRLLREEEYQELKSLKEHKKSINSNKTCNLTEE